MSVVKRLSEVIAAGYRPMHADMKAGLHREYWLEGGRGSGKSSFASIEVLLSVLRNPLSNAIVFRKVSATLRDSVFEQMMWAASALGIRGLLRASVMPMEIVYLPTGQKIMFKGADDPGKAKSIKLSRGYFGCLWFEEATEFSGMEDIRSIKASVLRGEKGITIMTYNPPNNRRHWVNIEASSRHEWRYLHKSDYSMLPREWLGESFIADAEALREANEREYRAMYLGEVSANGAQVFDNITLRELTDYEVMAFDRVYCGLDFGFAVDPDAFVKVAIDMKRGVLTFLDEYMMARTPLWRLAEVAQEKLGGCAFVTCDSADPRMIDELRRRDIRAVAAKKGAGSVERGIRRLKELREIVIDPVRCPNAAREFTLYEYARGRGGEILPAYPDRDNHIIDATRYALECEFAGREAKSFKRHAMGIW